MTITQPARYIHRINDQSGFQRPATICGEASALVTGQKLPKRTIEALGRMVPRRQVIAVHIMVALDNLTGDFARALLAATSPEDRSDDARGRQSHPAARGRLVKMEQGLVRLQSEAAAFQSYYNADVFYLALASSYLRNWTGSDVVYPWLCSRHPKFAVVLKNLVKVADLAIEPKRPMKLACRKIDEKPGVGKISVR